MNVFDAIKLLIEKEVLTADHIVIMTIKDALEKGRITPEQNLELLDFWQEHSEQTNSN